MSQTNLPTTRHTWILPLYGLLLLGLLLAWWQLPQLTTTLQAQEQDSVVTQFETPVLNDPEWLHLHSRTPVRLAQQVEAVATDGKTPASPIHLIVIDQQVGGVVTLQWEPAFGEDYTTYNIYRAAAAEGEGKLLTSDVQDTTYTDTSLETGSTYYYRVEGVVRYQGKDSTSQRSNVVVATPTDSTPPHAPTAVVAKNTQDGLAVRLTWIKPEDADFSHVRIYRSQAVGQLGDLIADQVVGEEYLDTSLPANNTKVYYTVTSVDQIGNESPTTLQTLPPGNPNPFQVLYQ